MPIPAWATGAISLTRSALKSRQVRTFLGERSIDIFSSLTSPEPQPDNNDGSIIPSFLNGAWSIAKRLGGFLLKAASAVGGWLLRNFWDLVVDAYFEIINFDFNQLDSDIEQQIEANNLQIFAALGQFTGSSVVWIASAGLAAGLSIKFPVIAGKVFMALAEEGYEEIRGQLMSLIQVAGNSVTRSLVLGGFLTLRRMRLFGLAPVTERREPWTIAEAVEEKVQSIPDARLRVFVENALEGAEEAVIEAGYVVQYAIDDYYQAAKYAQQSQLGKERAVKITPNENTPGESVILSGKAEILKPQIQQILGTHRLIHNRDVGAIVGQPAEDWYRAGVQRRKLTIVFKSKKEPPWRGTSGERVKTCTYTIPEPKRGLNWQELKTAARQYDWGKYRATANLDNGRQMAVYGASEGEAERKLRELLFLSTGELITLSVTEEKDRNIALRKDTQRMYPAFATLLVRRPTANLTGNTDLTGQRFEEESIRIDLWPDTEPPGFIPTL
ncbi:hypothetical protein ACQ4M4_05195 [Leptolyngbya sp. AN02str]|uniref:hypothetical protein n=1 Tax=Leptolyngbya sp. AN02str TaxID=3423363 RepID=UPI003D321CFE